jgi:hypothetical protein
VRSLTSHNPIGLQGVLRDSFTFFFLLLQAGRSRVRPYEVNELFPIYLILLAALGPGVYSASNRNEY